MPISEAIKYAKTKRCQSSQSLKLVKIEQQVLPKTKLGEAILYTLNQWDKLIAYTQDGQLNIDNNRAERCIKPFVIGRKNWLFSKGERRHASACAPSSARPPTASAIRLSDASASKNQALMILIRYTLGNRSGSGDSDGHAFAENRAEKKGSSNHVLFLLQLIKSAVPRLKGSGHHFFNN